MVWINCIVIMMLGVRPCLGIDEEMNDMPYDSFCLLLGPFV